MVVDSKLDALLVHQEASDITSVVAFGFVIARSDILTFNQSGNEPKKIEQMHNSH